MSDSKNIAVLGNFKDPNKIMHAANKVRESGYTDFTKFLSMFFRTSEILSEMIQYVVLFKYHHQR